MPNWSSTLCDLGVFVYQSVEQIATSEMKVGMAVSQVTAVDELFGSHTVVGRILILPTTSGDAKMPGLAPPMGACDLAFQRVGVAGFEPTASSSRTRYGSRSYLRQH